MEQAEIVALVLDGLRDELERREADEDSADE